MDLCIDTALIEITEAVFGEVIRIKDLPFNLLEEILFGLEVMCLTIEAID